MSRIYKDEPVERISRKKEWGIFFILIAILLGPFVLHFSIYELQSSHFTVRAVVDRVPVPAGKIGSNFVFYRDILEVQRYFDEIGFSGDTFDAALEVVVFNTYLELFAEEYGIDPVQERGWDELSNGERDVYGRIGWGSEEYVKFIARPLAVSQEIERFIYHEPRFHASVREEMENVRKQSEGGASFSELVRHYSSGLTRGTDGNLGYVYKKDLNPLLYHLFELSSGDTSEVIENAHGFSVYYVENVYPEADPYIHLWKIEQPKKTFSQVLGEFKQDNPVLLWIK